MHNPDACGLDVSAKELVVILVPFPFLRPAG